jgi:replicative DNA helicase
VTAAPVRPIRDVDPPRALDAPNDESLGYRFTSGGAFILDASTDPEPVWGDGRSVCWAAGEALVVAGRQGLGKTLLGAQLAFGRCGFGEYDSLLGYPIKPGSGRVLYLAMDRPRQIARAMRRMVGTAWRDDLDQRLAVWQGPPPYDLAKFPGLLLKLCEDAEADTVVVDSLKDAAVGLTDDEVGASYNRARQLAIAAGVEVVELHHQRKQVAGAKAEHPSLDDLYGSTWLTSGVGSVLLLTGSPGDPIVGVHHLKQPADEVGPLRVIHDGETGRSDVWHATDLLLIARAMPAGITAIDAARALFETESPSPAEKEKARRRLEALARSGELYVVDTGDKAANRPRKWGAICPV